MSLNKGTCELNSDYPLGHPSGEGRNPESSYYDRPRFTLPTLRDVIRKHYAVKGKAVSDGQAPSPLRDSLIEGFKVSDADMEDLVAFLETLTDNDFLTDPKLSDPFVKAAK